MRRGRVMSVMLVGAFVTIAACSSSNKSSTATTTTAASSTTSAATSATLAVATETKLGTEIIVAASGKAVYMFVPDGSSTTSKVPTAVKTVWPPVTASGTATVGSGLDQAKLALQPQPDGTEQVSYNGHLLYTFSGDTAPGTANGERLAGVWFVLSPAGTKIA